MDKQDHGPSNDGRPDPVRRALLAALLAGCAASYLPLAFSQSDNPAAREAFLKVSGLLTGRATLDGTLAARLYDALAADDARFAEQVQALRALIDQRDIAPLDLQAALDREHSSLAALPRKIVTAWYMGIVGDGERMRCVAYENALSMAIVADVLQPPTYCYGAYASWTRKPT